MTTVENDIEVQGLTKLYGDLYAIRELSFAVPRGDILGFLGPNGAGKSTTMKILTCLFPPTHGAARVAGHDVFQESLQVRQKVGYLPENPPLYTDMHVEGYLRFAAKIRDVPGREVNRRVEDVMGRTGLLKRRRQLIGHLSKGYRQRVGLAQAMVHNPQVLILDEPTSGLDPAQIIEVRQLIRSLGEKHTVVLSTHILPEVSQICESVIIINEGRIVAQGTPENLLEGMGDQRRLELRVRGKQAQARELLEKVEGVLSVRHEPTRSNGHELLLVHLDSKVDAREEIAKVLVENQFGLAEMRSLGSSLEDLYLKLVSGGVLATADLKDAEGQAESTAAAEQEQASEKEEKA